MDAFLTKPVDSALLLETLDSLADDPAAEDRHSPIGETPRAAGDKERTAVVDTGAIETLRALDPDPRFLTGVVRDFIADTEEILQDLHAALDDRDLSEFRNHAHGLRSSAANVGAARLRRFAGELNAISWTDFECNGEARLDDLVREFALYRETIARQLEEMAIPAKL
jgi:two-component system sensor histidine kinase RpfC